MLGPGPGTQLGRYRLVEPLGRGGMGTVFKAVDAELERTVAVKVLSPLLAADPGFVERFRREARTAAGLRHTNIVVVHDWGSQDGIPFLVMELLEGQSLKELIQQQGRLPLVSVQLLIRQCAAALDYAHARGVVHRDVKPGNVMVDPGSRATLTDFGIARAASSGQLTATGGILGTPEYLSPEQALGRPVDGRSDVYSLGVMLYELLAGRTPFQADSTPAVLHLQAYAPPPSLEGIRPDLSPEIVGIVGRALAKNPDERIGSAGELASALDAALGDGAPTAIGAGPTRVESRSEPMRASWPAPPAGGHYGVVQREPGAARQPLPRFATWVGAAVAAVLLIAAGAFLFGPSAERAPATPTALVSAPKATAAVAAASPAQSQASLVLSPTAAASPVAVAPPAASPAAAASPTPPPDPVAVLAREGDTLFDSDLQAAVARYQQAVEQNPNSALAQRQLGIGLFWLARNRDYTRHLEQATRLNTGDARAWAYLADALWSDNVYEASTAAVAEAVKIDPDSSDTLAARALEQVRRNDFAGGIALADQAVQKAPSNELALRAAIVARASADDYAGAEHAARRLLQLHPNWSAPHALLGDVLRLQQRYDDARQEYMLAASLDPNVLWLHGRRAWLAFAESDYDTAEREFRAAVQEDAKDAEPWVGLGLIFLERQQHQLALDHFKRAQAIDPRSSAAYTGVGYALTNGFDKHLEAEANFRKAIELYARNADAYLGLGISQYRRGQYEPALHAFRTAVDVFPNIANSHHWAGVTLLELGKPGEARSYLERANELRPGDPDIEGDLAEARRRGG